MDSTEVFCPAKINLFLAVTGRRTDGFHNLISLMAPLDWGDRLSLAWEGPRGDCRLTCSDPALPVDNSNLARQAASAFDRHHPLPRGVRIDLQKRIPSGAGLGGGSSDAAGVLLGLNRLCGQPFSGERLRMIAAEVGSDCPFFLMEGPAVARGRGEWLEPASPEAARRLRGVRVLLCKPFFGVSTPWAFAALARRENGWMPAETAEERLQKWSSHGEMPWSALLHNDFEPAVFAKFIALEVIKRELADTFGCPVLMSGSGSTLFAVLAPGQDDAPLRDHIRNAYGPNAFVQTAAISLSRP